MWPSLPVSTASTIVSPSVILSLEPDETVFQDNAPEPSVCKYCPLEPALDGKVNVNAPPLPAAANVVLFVPSPTRTLLSFTKTPSIVTPAADVFSPNVSTKRAPVLSNLILSVPSVVNLIWPSLPVSTVSTVVFPSVIESLASDTTLLQDKLPEPSVFKYWPLEPEADGNVKVNAPPPEPALKVVLFDALSSEYIVKPLSINKLFLISNELVVLNVDVPKLTVYALLVEVCSVLTFPKVPL